MMFELDGKCYAGTPGHPILLTDFPYVVWVEPYDETTLLVQFYTDEKRLFPLDALIGPVFEPLHRDHDEFCNPGLSHGVVTWMDEELDIAPEYMYDHSIEYREGTVIES